MRYIFLVNEKYLSRSLFSDDRKLQMLICCQAKRLQQIMSDSRVALIVPACQLGWTEMENLRKGENSGNLRGNNSE